MEQLTAGLPSHPILSSTLILSKKTASSQDVLVPLTATMIFKKTSLLGQKYYEETRTREVDKNLVEASISKDPAAGTLSQD